MADPDIDLATVEDVKEYLSTSGFSFPPDDDGLLGKMITGASDFVEHWLARTFAVKTWTEVQDGTGGNAITLTNTPILQVASLAIDGQPIPAAPADGGFQAGYLFTDSEVIVRGFYFWRRRQNIIVTYQAGFAEIPPAVNRAVIELVALRYRQRTRVGEVSTHFHDGSTTTFSQKDMDAGTAAELKAFKRVAPVRGSVRLATTQL